MLDTVVVLDKTFELLISPEELDAKVQELGRQVHKRYHGKNPIFLPVLNGAFIFAADLIRYSNLTCEVSFVKLGSYRGMQSTGELSERIGLDTDIEGKDVIIVEDIVDTGNTLSKFLPELQRLNPKSLSVATMLLKPDILENPLPIDFKGFDVSPAFVVGYGLDYDGYGRELRGIYQLKTPD